MIRTDTKAYAVLMRFKELFKEKYGHSTNPKNLPSTNLGYCDEFLDQSQEGDLKTLSIQAMREIAGMDIENIDYIQLSTEKTEIVVHTFPADDEFEGNIFAIGFQDGSSITAVPFMTTNSIHIS